MLQAMEHLTLLISLHFDQAGQDDDPVLEEALGFGLFSQGQAKLGWLMNLNEVCGTTMLFHPLPAI